MLNYAKDENALDLTKAHTLDAGFDLASPISIVCKPFTLTTIDTGIHIELRTDEVAFVQPRSSTSKLGIFVITGTIDAGYTGSLKIQIVNFTNSDVVIIRGQRVAQIVVTKNSRVFENARNISFSNFEFDDSENARGDKGFGSSGV